MKLNKQNLISGWLCVGQGLGRGRGRGLDSHHGLVWAPGMDGAALLADKGYAARRTSVYSFWIWGGRTLRNRYWEVVRRVVLEFTEVSKLTGAKEFGGCSWIHGYRRCRGGCNLWMWKRGLHTPQKPSLSGERGQEQWGGGRAVTDPDGDASHRLLEFCQGNSETFVVIEL